MAIEGVVPFLGSVLLRNNQDAFRSEIWTLYDALVQWNDKSLPPLSTSNNHSTVARLYTHP